MASNLPPPSLSASITRIISLRGFPPELKTKDIQNAFTEWEGVLGGFKIKWVDDTSLLLVFADPTVAKRAYLQMILSPPPSLVSPTSALTLLAKPYDGPDAQSVIYTVNSRRNNSARSGSISGPGPSGPHVRGMSVSSAQNNDPRRSMDITGPSGSGNGNGVPRGPSGQPSWKTNNSGNGGGLAGSMHAPRTGDGGDQSPTLPDLPPHPTLNALINSSLDPSNSSISEVEEHSSSITPPPSDITSPVDNMGSPPRVGDPARRMLGAALGVKHPGVTPRVRSDASEAVSGGLSKAMGGMVIAE